MIFTFGVQSGTYTLSTSLLTDLEVSVPAEWAFTSSNEITVIKQQQ